MTTIKIEQNNNNDFKFKYNPNNIIFYVPKILYSLNIKDQIYLNFFNDISQDSDFLLHFKTLGIKKNIISECFLEIHNKLNSNKLLQIIDSRLIIYNLSYKSDFLDEFLDEFNLNTTEVDKLKNDIKQSKKYTLEEIEKIFNKQKINKKNEIINKLYELSISNNTNATELINEIIFLNNGIIFEKVLGYKLLGKPNININDDGFNFSSPNKDLSLIVDNYYTDNNFRYVVDFKFYEYDSGHTNDLYKQIIYCAYLKNHYRITNNLNVIGVLLYVSNKTQEELSFNSHIKFLDIDIISLSVSNKFILEFRNQHNNFKQKLSKKIDEVLKKNNFNRFILKA